MTKIQVKRGLEKDLPILSQAEPGFTTDTEKVFIGGNSGNIELAKMKDLFGLNTYRTEYSYYPNTTNIQTETVKDSNNNVIGVTTYTYVNENLDTSVLVMNGQTIKTKYNYDGSGKLTSLVNTKS